MSSHVPIKIYVGGLILGVNTLYRLFCFFKLFPMIGKGLTITDPIVVIFLSYHYPREWGASPTEEETGRCHHQQGHPGYLLQANGSHGKPGLLDRVPASHGRNRTKGT